MPRWTVRGVTPEAITAVEHVQNEIGASLGEIVTACIELGLPEARRRLEQEYPVYNQPSPEVIALKESLQRVISAFEVQQHRSVICLDAGIQTVGARTTL